MRGDGFAWGDSVTFDQIWESLLRKSPRLANDRTLVEFEAAALRRLLRQVYEQGEAFERSKQKTGRDAPSVWEELFGGMR